MDYSSQHDHDPTSAPSTADAEGRMLFNEPAALQRLGEDSELLRDACTMFLTIGTERREALRQAAAEGDTARMSQQAHILKSTCASLGLEQCQDAARRLEEAVNSGDRELARAMLAQLLPLLSSSLSVIQNYLSE